MLIYCGLWGKVSLLISIGPTFIRNTRESFWEPKYNIFYVKNRITAFYVSFCNIGISTIVCILYHGRARRTHGLALCAFSIEFQGSPISEEFAPLSDLQTPNSKRKKWEGRPGQIVMMEKYALTQTTYKCMSLRHIFPLKNNLYT